MSVITVYLKCERSVQVQTPDVYMRDIGSLRCENKEIGDRLNHLQVYHFEQGAGKRCVISCLRLVELMEAEVPNILVQIVGEPDTLIEWVEVDQYRGFARGLQIGMVCLVSFFGTAFAIMAYHNDVGIRDVFAQIYRIVMNAEPGAVNTLEVSYSIGLALGIIVFFNHVGGRRITNDPTPIEVALRNYEEDVDKTLIAVADREAWEIEGS